jgi:catechol 2,3-dioxygenase-like lactoylglutathione lyase family enzyme
MSAEDQPSNKFEDRATRRIKTAPFSFCTNTDVSIYVADINKAEEFYGESLGFRLVSRSKDHLEFDTGALRLNVYCGDPARQVIPAMEVSDLAGAAKYLENAGCTLIPLPDGGMNFRDPFGLLFALVERPPD